MLESATTMLEREVNEWRHVYVAAIERSRTGEFRDAASAAVEKALRGTGADGDEPGGAMPPLELGDGPAAEASDFVTGSVHLNRMHRRVGELGFDEKRALIYGGDMIVP